jgi:hypothetical protein
MRPVLGRSPSGVQSSYYLRIRLSSRQVVIYITLSDMTMIAECSWIPGRLLGVFSYHVILNYTERNDDTAVLMCAMRRVL